jgi:hypothetical protein
MQDAIGETLYTYALAVLVYILVLELAPVVARIGA